jgi:aminoglycoside phosphotransferase (APT) family kinase protein
MDDDLRHFLQEEGLAGEECVATPLGGGVSSDVWLVEAGGRSIVVKRSVAKLRVQADWFSDPARLRYEFLYLQTVGNILPQAVPRVLSRSPDAPFLAMEFLGAGFENWKTLLLAGRCEKEDARRAGATLGCIHAATRMQADVRERFDTMEYFSQLRLEAYLRTTADRHPGAVGDAINQEVARLTGHAECLVHGDFSPKNMLTSRERLVILDCETACFGDPAFDLAFLLNHLCLKALYHAPVDHGLGGLVEATLQAYREADPAHATVVENRTAILLPMLQLARVDGKSPVEYLNPSQQQRLRELACAAILRQENDLSAVLRSWFQALGLPATV